jgi:hypothetical protein
MAATYSVTIMNTMLEFPDYFEVVTCDLSDEEKADPMAYDHTCGHDIVCEDGSLHGRCHRLHASDKGEGY